MATAVSSSSSSALVERLRQIFDAFALQGAAAATHTTRYLFRLTGPSAGSILLQVTPQGVTWTPTDTETADVTIKLDASDLVAIADGSLDGRLALASEKIEIEGDVEAAARMVAEICPEQAEG